MPHFPDVNVSRQIKKYKSDTVWSLLCCVPFLGLIFCFLAGVRMAHSELCRFYVRQGLVLFVLLIVAGFFLLLVPGFGRIFLFAVVLLHFVSIFYALRRIKIQIPLVSYFSLLIPEYYFYEKLTGKDMWLMIWRN